MTMLLTEKTKQEKIINEAQKKRNLFGLGLTSLIAACAADDAAENGATKVDHGTIPTEGLTAADADQLSAHTAATAAITIATLANANDVPRNATGAVKNDLQIDITALTGVNSLFTATFKNGNHQTSGSAAIYTTLTANNSDLVVSSNQFGDAAGTAEGITGAIYIVWNMSALLTFDETASTKYLKVAGVEAADVIASDTPEFHQIGGAKDGDAAQADMVFRSGATAAMTTNINILWDVTQHAGKTDAAVTATLGAADNGILQVQNAAALTAPKFTKVNSNEDYDMIVKGPADTHILWDVAEYHDPVKNVVIDLADTNTTGFLKIEGTGTAAPEFIKVNNNDGYDMIVKGSAGITHILWDVAEYQKATDAKAVVNLANPDTMDEEATYGLLTITGLADKIKTGPITPDSSEIGFIDIDGGGINDLAFVYGNNTFILFGEKIANRDGNGTAISHTVNLSSIEFYFDNVAPSGFFSADDFLATTAATGQPADAIGYRFDLVDQGKLTTLADIKGEYEAAINPDPTLSEEAYWDIA